MISACSASSSTAPTDRRAPSEVVPQPVRVRRLSSLMVTMTVAGTPPDSGSPPVRRSRSHTSSRASCSRCPCVRSSASSTGRPSGPVTRATRGRARGRRTATSFAPSAPVSRSSPRQDPSRAARSSTCRRSAFNSSAGTLPSGSRCSTNRATHTVRSFGPKVPANPVSIASPRPTSAGSNPARSTVTSPRSTTSTCSVVIPPSRCAAASTGRTDGCGSPSMLTRSPSCSAARTRRPASAAEICRACTSSRGTRPWQYRSASPRSDTAATS